MSSFAIHTQVFFGDRAHEDMHQWIADRKFKRITVILDDNLQAHPVVTEILNQYQQHSYVINELLPFKALAEPSYDQLDSLTALARTQPCPDLILAFGGGTVIDMAKGVGILLKNSGKGIDYRGMNKVTQAGIPVIVYPTTAGTGSEVTWTASFIDAHEKKKLGINGAHVTPLCGVLDPRLVASCPRSVALSSGLDAMVHAIEAVTAKTATPLTQILGSQAFAMMYEWLPICLSEGPARLEAWEKVQLAAYIAGIAMMNAGGGPASGISYPLGVHYDVPHGIAGGIFLPSVFQLNVEKGYDGYAQVYDLLPDRDMTLRSASEKSQDFVKKFNCFYASIKAPMNLQHWQCAGETAIDQLTQLTINQRLENLHLNPVPLEKQDVESLITSVCAG